MEHENTLTVGREEEVPARCHPVALAGHSCEAGAVTKASQAGIIKLICKHVQKTVSNHRKRPFLFTRLGVVIVISVWA